MAKLPIIGTVREATGFVGAHYDDALRLTWLPVLLVMGWFGIAVPWIAPNLAPLPMPGRIAGLFLVTQVVPLLLSAMYLGPLVRLAARGEAPDHGTAPLRLGWSPLRYTAGTLLSLGATLLATQPVVFAAAAAMGLVDGLAAAEVAVFEEGSLHAVEFVPAIEPDQIDALRHAPTAILLLGVAILWARGLRPVRAVLVASATIALALHMQLLLFVLAQGLFILAPAPAQAMLLMAMRLDLFSAAFLLLVAYVSLRLLPLAWFWAARRREDGWPVFRTTLRASGRANRFRLLLSYLGLALLMVLVARIAAIVPLTFNLGLAGAGELMAGMSALVNGGAPADWVAMALSGARTIFGYAYVVALTALSAALTAGFGGAVVRFALRDQAD